MTAPATQPTQETDGGEYVRGFYGVPAHVGCRVVVTRHGRGYGGTVVDFAGAMIVVVMDDGVLWPDPVPLHPTWQITYVDGGEGGGRG